mmetsp:Transcript_26457/g.103075  ORF Transcript_26457/g.103075 Transcript_26457/m.103075 type:complete len:93 (-) Transcript_26457:603-881(-)
MTPGKANEVHLMPKAHPETKPVMNSHSHLLAVFGFVVRQSTSAQYIERVQKKINWESRRISLDSTTSRLSSARQNAGTNAAGGTKLSILQVL